MKLRRRHGSLQAVVVIAVVGCLVAHSPRSTVVGFTTCRTWTAWTGTSRGASSDDDDVTFEPPPSVPPLRRRRKGRRPLIPLPPPADTLPIIDHTGRAWHSNKSLDRLLGLRRDGLPHTPSVNPDGSTVVWRAALGASQSMLRRKPGVGQVPHFEEDDERWSCRYERLVGLLLRDDERRTDDDDDDDDRRRSLPADPGEDADEETQQLYRWCNRQRYQYAIYRANGMYEFDRVTHKRVALISEWRISQLEKLNFDFRIQSVKWNDRYRQLRNFYEEHGHSDVRLSHLRDGLVEEGFYWWVKLQRVERRRYKVMSLQKQNDTIVCSLDKERIKMLDKLHFQWDPREASWNRHFDQVKLFKKVHGHCRVPPYSNSNISRMMKDEDIVESDEIDEDEIDEDEIDDDEDTTNNKYTANPLGKWVKRQRYQYWRLRNGDVTASASPLTPQRIERLDSLNFEWSPLEALWHFRLEELLEFKKKEGHCDVPVNYEENPSLAIWVREQRRHHVVEQNLSEERRRTLEEVGFSFQPFRTKWETKFQELVLFQEEHGHCNVPKGGKQHRQLGNWVQWQRKQYRLLSEIREKGAKDEEGKIIRSSTMTPERIERLEALGFMWSLSPDSKSSLSEWEKHLALLQQFQKEHGHSNPSKISDKIESLVLYNWVQTQRQLYRRDTLAQDRIQKLESVPGFVWNTKKALWKERYWELLQYKEQHGNCRVPTSRGKLGPWVSVQRVQYKKYKAGTSSNMTEERIQELEAVGFEWSVVRQKT